MRQTDDYSLDLSREYVRCRSCGEYCEVAPELLGDDKPEDVTDFVCEACIPFDETPTEDEEWMPDEERPDSDFCPNCGHDLSDCSDYGCWQCTPGPVLP